MNSITRRSCPRFPSGWLTCQLDGCLSLRASLGRIPSAADAISSGIARVSDCDSLTLDVGINHCNSDVTDIRSGGARHQQSVDGFEQGVGVISLQKIERIEF